MTQFPLETPAIGRADTTVSADPTVVFNKVFDLFGNLDLNGLVLNLHGRIFEKTNTNPSLLIGQQFSQTVFWQSSENTSKLLEKAIEKAAGCGDSRLVLDFRISADEKVPVDLSLQRISGVNGSDQIFFCARVIEKSTGIANYKKEGEHLLQAAEHAEIGLWFWDFNDEKIYSTPVCNELLGIPTYETINYEMFLNAVHIDDRPLLDQILRSARLEGTKFEEEFRVVYSDGSMDWLSTEGKSFVDDKGEPQRMMGVVRKITEQKLAAEELARVYDREKRARDEAVEANRAKDFFLAFVSHELRSPLNAILGWSKILLTKDVDTETRRSALETIERSARVQTKLINDLVDSARVASGKLRLEYHPTNLYEIVRTSYQAQKPTADAHNLLFEFTADRVDVTIFGDAGRLQQVFSNLISNAIKFTPEGGSVSIEIRTETDTVSVHIKDSGQGISPEALPHIFRQFSQGDMSRARNNAGLGLGLSIVKILVGKHGGTVRAESEGLGLGAEFIVTFPLSDSTGNSLPRRATAAKAKPLKGLNILVVEDDNDSREVLQLFLEQSGASVFAAESAGRARGHLAQSRERLPDIIISDLAMPEEDGYTMLETVRGLDPSEGGKIPAIALSAFATAESKEHAYAAGFQKYATKPFEPETLISDILELAAKRD